MSDSKPCPVEALTAISTGKLAKQLCAKCPNRAPSPVEVELRECHEAIAEFCKAHAWADKGWKAEAETKRLFDIAAKLDASENKKKGVKE